MPQLTQDQSTNLHAGVTLMLTNWYALRAAVEHGWGGHETEAKAQWFLDTIAEYLISDGHKIDEEDLADVLEDIMSEEFQTLLEDNSGYVMAKMLYALYLECVKGDYSRVAKLREQFPNTRLPAVVGGGDGGDSSDEGEQGEEGDTALQAAAAAQGQDGDAMDVDQQEPEPEQRGPVVDEDGFMMVSKKGKNKRK
ncbi:Pre-rRNA-processing protein TSR2-domain-containing protein [Catenaria anguillulae PL171]|uniref:Pre-rRNA-processing protein TSR2-domain-containing protein n=1 Tax=Catenaria anguillulae PL171 TaxID=765915 RepID=A0A1Y2HXF7_9FUNG|nr:Pre-rRNA-processing protein TSR2-domain-containing protein [Catenaria anguillulae PL171]